MRAVLKILVFGSLTLSLLANPVWAASSSGPLSFNFDFLTNFRNTLQLTFAFDQKEKAKIEISLAQAQLNEVKGLTSAVDAGPALEEYTHHLEKAVTITSKLPESDRAAVQPEISKAIQDSTPVITQQAAQAQQAQQAQAQAKLSPQITSTVGKTVQANQWAANTISKGNPAAASALQPAIEAQVKAVEVPKPLPSQAVRTVHVPILMYHYVRTVEAKKDPLGYALSVTPGDLEQQANYLEKNGFHTINPAQLVAALKSGTALPSKPIILTFDDSYRDFYTSGLSILTAHHLIATNYVISDYVKGNYPAYMTVDMVKAIVAAGMNVAAHTRTHVDLTKQSQANALDQIQGSKTALEALIGKPVLDFAYPYGAYNTTVVSQVAQAGFADARTTNWGATHVSNNILILPTIRISGGDSLKTFINKVNQ